MNPSANLFLIGPTGAGKTCVGRRLAEHYALPFVDLDHLIEERTGVDVATVFEIEGAEGFRRRESDLLAECSARRGIVLATGAGAVLAPANRRRLQEGGYVVWLQASIDQQLARLAHDTSRPLLAGADRTQRLQAMAHEREPLYRDLADLVVPGRTESSRAAASRAAGLIDRHWQRADTETA